MCRLNLFCFPNFLSIYCYCPWTSLPQRHFLYVFLLWRRILQAFAPPLAEILSSLATPMSTAQRVLIFFFFFPSLFVSEPWVIFARDSAFRSILSKSVLAIDVSNDWNMYVRVLTCLCHSLRESHHLCVRKHSSLALIFCGGDSGTATIMYTLSLSCCHGFLSICCFRSFRSFRFFRRFRRFRRQNASYSLYLSATHSEIIPPIVTLIAALDAYRKIEVAFDLT